MPITIDNTMPSIDDFKKSVTEMSDDELNEILNHSRNERASSSKSKKKKRKAKTKTEDLSLDNIENLTPAQARKLLDKLKGND